MNECNNIVIGSFSSSETFSNCIVIGDETVAERDGDVKVGGSLFGADIPADVKAMIEKNPGEVRFLLETIFRALDSFHVLRNAE